MKRFAFIMALLLPLAVLAQKSTLNGTVKGLGDGMGLVVLEPQGGRLIPIDTLYLNASGNFKLERKSTSPVFLAIVPTVAQAQPLHLLMLPGEKISLGLEYQADHSLLLISSVKGSNNMEVYRQYNNLMVEAFDNTTLQAEMPHRMETLIRDNASVLISAFLVTYFESAFEQYAALYKQVRDALIDNYADNEFVRHIDQKVRTVVMVGMEAPEIVMAGADGVEHRLSDLLGKVVLIDFWASWCRPCRMENPNVVRVYNKYHEKGFDIFSVSLDNNRDAWLNAIQSDGLIWPDHVSDLRGWSSAAGRLYGVSSIPATVLVGRDGKVLARNLRGAQLEQKLKEIFGE